MKSIGWCRWHTRQHKMSASSIMHIFMEKLLSLQCNMCEQRACDIFGSRMGSHLYEKFERLDCNILFWYNSLDTQNRNLLVAHVENEIDGMSRRGKRFQKTLHA